MGSPDSSLLAAAFDSLDFAVTCVDHAGTILFVNAIAARNLSAPRDDLIGTSLYDHFPEKAGATRERLRQTIESRETQHFEAVVNLPDGSQRWFQSSYCPAFDDDGRVVSIQIVARDVTAERRPTPDDDDALWGMVTDDLSMTVERIRALLSSAPMVISVHDPDMTIRYINWVIDGISTRDVIGQSGLTWLEEDSRPVMSAAFARVCKTAEPTEYRVKGLSGKTWLIRLAPLVHDGVVTQILSCTLDLTEETRLQAELAQAQKTESLGTMARGIAHDFNNLLAVILGDAGLARRRAAAGGDPTPHLDEISAAAGRAAELCEQMLLYAGRDPSSHAPGNLNAVIADMTRLTRAAVRTNVVICYDLADELPATKCGGTLLGQVVLNLINNAADAIGDQQGEVRVSTEDVVVRELEGSYVPGPPAPGRYALLRVQDTGRGIDADALQVVFDPFYSTKSAGRGLGLSVVLGIVSSHGGAISVDSTPGEGTAITVLLPVLDGEVACAESATVEDEWPRGTGLVLVVDDEPAMLRMARSVLEDVGYEVLVASNGDEALDVMASRGDELRAVLLDVTMPARDGHSTLAAIREQRASMPVLLSSGRPTEVPNDDPHVGLLSKPYEACELAVAMADVLSERAPIPRS